MADFPAVAFECLDDVLTPAGKPRSSRRFALTRSLGVLFLSRRPNSLWRLQLRAKIEDPQRPHALTVPLQTKDNRTRKIHPKPDPSTAGTEQLGRLAILSRRQDRQCLGHLNAELTRSELGKICACGLAAVLGRALEPVFAFRGSLQVGFLRKDDAEAELGFHGAKFCGFAEPFDAFV
jgi:hypothetical protein